MEYSNCNKINYYAIYDYKYDEQIIGSDLLCKIRKKFFETGLKQKSKVTYKEGETVYRYSYFLQEGKPLKWKKMIDSEIVEISKLNNDGTYSVFTYNDKILTKIIKFDNNHKWIKTEYFNSRNKKDPKIILKPSGLNITVLGINNEGHKFSYELEESTITSDLKEAFKDTNTEFQIVSETNKGKLCYLIKNEATKEKPSEDTSNANADNYNDINMLLPFDGEEKIDDSIKDGFKIDLENKEKNTINDIIVNNEEQCEDKKLKENEDLAIEQENLIAESLPFLNYEKQKLLHLSFYDKLPSKVIENLNDEKYYYFGSLKDGDMRSGRGRTEMENGYTAYEGNYLDDKRDGFGVYYYKTGKLCYAGNWRSNKKNGTGVSFSPINGHMHIGNWEEDSPVGMSSRFDKDGNLIFSGKFENGMKQGASISYSAKDGKVFVGKWKDDILINKMAEFDLDGNLIYNGEWENSMRNGQGIEYNDNGEIVYKGCFKDNKYDGEGTLYFKSGHKIHGKFKSGKLFGRGTMYKKDGSKIDGYFTNTTDENCQKIVFDDVIYYFTPSV